MVLTRRGRCYFNCKTIVANSSGANAGTMFGDGVYLAEDMGKSDQYCRTLDAKVATAFKTLAGPKRDAAAVKTVGWKATKDPKSGDTWVPRHSASPAIVLHEPVLRNADLLRPTNSPMRGMLRPLS